MNKKTNILSLFKLKKTLCTKKRGFTLIEVLVASFLFSILVGISVSATYEIYRYNTKIQYNQQLYSETRFLMERIVGQIRDNTIDYYEYFDHNLANMDGNTAGLLPPVANEYGKNPGKYEMFFYAIPDYIEQENDVADVNFSWDSSDRSADINMGYFNTGANSVASDDLSEDTAMGSLAGLSSLSQSFQSDVTELHDQEELYLLSKNGLEKTIIRLENGRVQIKKYVLEDTNSDGVEEVWNAHPDYTTFVDITPSGLEVTYLNFFVTPLDDPFKGFAESMYEGAVQPALQPHVIVQIKAKLSEGREKVLLGLNNEFYLQTSATSRVMNNVTFPRN